MKTTKILIMIRSAALPVVEEASLTNRKKHRELQAGARKATMFLTGNKI